MKVILICGIAVSMLNKEGRGFLHACSIKLSYGIGKKERGYRIPPTAPAL